MKKISTRLFSNEAVLSLPAELDSPESLVVKPDKSSLQPGISTLLSIRQFARAYRAVSSAVMAESPGYVLN